MSSGIAIAQECIDAHKDIVDRKLNAIVLKIGDDLEQVVVDKKFPAAGDDIEGNWKAIIDYLTDSDCRFIISDFLVSETPTVVRSKIVLISWNPEDASVKSKVLYSASRETVITKLPVQSSTQVSERSELQYGTMKEALMGK